MPTSTTPSCDVASKPFSPTEKAEIQLDGSEITYSFGGEARIDGFHHREYGLDFDKVAIHGLTPEQAVKLALDLVNHLMNNGHEFSISSGDGWAPRFSAVAKTE